VVGELSPLNAWTFAELAADDVSLWSELAGVMVTHSERGSGQIVAVEQRLNYTPLISLELPEGLKVWPINSFENGKTTIFIPEELMSRAQEIRRLRVESKLEAARKAEIEAATHERWIEEQRQAQLSQEAAVKRAWMAEIDRQAIEREKLKKDMEEREAERADQIEIDRQSAAEKERALSRDEWLSQREGQSRFDHLSARRNGARTGAASSLTSGGARRPIPQLSFISRFNVLCFFHFTDTRNLSSIRNAGGLCSMKMLRSRGIIPVAPGGNYWSHEADTRRNLDSYVHLCFINNHPMEYRARVEGRINQTAFLKIDPSVLFDEGVVFTSDVSNKTGVQCLSFEEALEIIDFSVIYDHCDWNAPEVRERRNLARKCEILVPEMISLSKIRGL